MEDEPLDEKSFTLVAIDIPDPVDDPRVMEVQFGKLIEAALPPKSNFVDVQLEPWSQLETDIYVFFLAHIGTGQSGPRLANTSRCIVNAQIKTTRPMLSGSSEHTCSS